MLALKNVSKRYGKNTLLKDASLEIGPKDNVCIVGPAGSGKTTMMHMLLRMVEPTSGTVVVDGVNIKAVPPAILQLYRRRTGAIFQEPMLLLHATVRENISLPLEFFGVRPSAIRKAADDLLQRSGLFEKADQLATSLSASEKVMLHIGRALIASPMIILADEPLQLLDEKQKKIVTELFTNMHTHGSTLILFSNSQETAEAFGARIVELKNNELHTVGRKTAVMKKTDHTHNILEKTDEETEDQTANKAPAHKGLPEKSDKIKITSIGSAL